MERRETNATVVTKIAISSSSRMPVPMLGLFHDIIKRLLNEGESQTVEYAALGDLASSLSTHVIFGLVSYV